MPIPTESRAGAIVGVTAFAVIAAYTWLICLRGAWTAALIVYYTVLPFSLATSRMLDIAQGAIALGEHARTVVELAIDTAIGCVEFAVVGALASRIKGRGRTR
jgi:hypothetical protein